jgi:hypothetical protein
MKINEINAPVLPDTYEASMFLSQAIRAGKYAIQIHNVLKNEQEVESWVAKKIDLATAYVNSVAHYLETQQVFMKTLVKDTWPNLNCIQRQNQQSKYTDGSSR